MARQPYLPNYQQVRYAIGALEIRNNTAFCELIGKCIALWSFVDNEMGGLFGILVGSDSAASMEVFMTLRRSTNQREAIEAAARHALDDDRERDALAALLGIYKGLEAERNNLAHGCWGFAPDNPEIMFWMDSKDHLHRNMTILNKFKNGNFESDVHRPIKERLFVYKMKDIELIHQEFEDFWWSLFYLNGYLRERENPGRVREFNEIYSKPRIQQEMARQKEARENNNQRRV
jgi:hypothetical protein